MPRTIDIRLWTQIFVDGHSVRCFMMVNIADFCAVVAIILYNNNVVSPYTELHQIDFAHLS